MSGGDELTIEYTGQDMTVTEFEATAGILLRFQALVKHFLDTIQPENTDQNNPNIPTMGFSIYVSRESAGLRTPLPPRLSTWV
jgi:hypothetical protein